MNEYDLFSACYDRFTEDVDYPARSRHLLSLFERFDRRPRILLDLACGTGGFSYELAAAGIDVIGVDRSEGMLAAARAKQPPNSQNPLFLMQSAEELDLYGTVDGAICMLDSLNHITDSATLSRVFGRVSLFLEQDRLFIFDLNTRYKHEQVLGDNVFVRETSDAFCVWQNEKAGDGLVNLYLDFFLQTPDGTYERFSEDITERAYPREQIELLLRQNGFQTVAVFDDLSDQPPGAQCERMTYIVRKVSHGKVD